MIEIIKIYRQNINALRFIGKKYDNADRADGSFGVKSKWDEWFENGWFEAVKSNINGNPDDTCEDGGAYIGMAHNKRGEPFRYTCFAFERHVFPRFATPDDKGNIVLDVCFFMAFFY